MPYTMQEIKPVMRIQPKLPGIPMPPRLVLDGERSAILLRVVDRETIERCWFSFEQLLH